MRIRPAFTVLVIAASLGWASFAVAADPQPHPFKVTTKQPADKVTITTENGTTFFSLRSPGGIGQAAVERTADAWPKHNVVRLHLAGLESFRISNGKTTLNVAVLSSAVSSNTDQQRIRVWRDADENTPLNSKDRLWIEVRILDEAGKPTESIPLKNGRFELQLPEAFFADNPKSITLNWIDFYRN